MSRELGPFCEKLAGWKCDPPFSHIGTGITGTYLQEKEDLIECSGGRVYAIFSQACGIEPAEKKFMIL